MIKKESALLIMVIIFLAILFTACESAAIPGITAEESSSSNDEGASPEPTEEETLVITPTPRPTATPGVVSEVVKDLTQAVGAEETLVLGLYVEDWINLGVSVLIALLGITIIAHLVLLITRWIGRRISEKYRFFLQKIEPQVRWLVGLVAVQFATTRLVFLSGETKEILDQIYFVLYVLIGSLILSKLLDFTLDWYSNRIPAEADSSRYKVLFPLASRTARFLLIAVAITIILDRFGVSVVALTTVLGIGGLAISLAAQDTLADAISGYIILLDQPFRIGDRIEIQGLDTWGDVVDIGARTTRIRTRDNRLVIVPNSNIGKSQVVNYSYPDPRYRVQVEIGIAYESDLDEVRNVIVEAVKKVEGVLPDKPVDALFLQFAESGMVFRVRWWIDSYTDTRVMFDKVNSAIYKALNETGIELGYTTYGIKLDHSDKEYFSRK